MQKLLSIGLATCFIVFASGSSYASQIMAISNVNIPPYQEAIEGLRTQVGLPVREYYLGTKNENAAEVRKAVDNQNPDLIFALGTQALRFSRELKRSTPVVTAFVLHPEDEKGKIHESGVSMVISPYRQLQYLLKVVSGMRKVGVVYDPNKSKFLIRQYQSAAKRLGVKLLARQANSTSETSLAIDELMQEVDAFWLVPDTTTLNRNSFRQLLELSLKRNVPLLGFAAKHARAGALLALGFDNRKVGAQVGKIAHRILKAGGHGRETEFLSPDHVTLSINKRTAEIMGLNIPESFYRLADEIYE